MSDLVELTQQYFSALEAGATGDALARFYQPDVIQEEFPNSLAPQGTRRDLHEILASAERGQQVMSAQRYEILNIVATGNSVAVEFRWIGTLAIPLGNLPAGGEIRGHFASFLDFRADRIIAQRSYDCFEAW